jgi:hypothetical protein
MLRAHAVLLGERFGRDALSDDGALIAAPLSFRVGESGFVALFRYGAAVMFGSRRLELTIVVLILAVLALALVQLFGVRL